MRKKEKKKKTSNLNYENFKKIYIYIGGCHSYQDA